MRRKSSFLAGVLLALALPAPALDLHQAYVLSLAQDATLRAAQAAAAAGQEKVPQARAQMLPQLSLSAASYSNRLDARTGNLPSTERDYPSRNATLTLRQAVFRPMLAAGYRQAQAQAEDSQARLNQAQGQLSVRVSEAYFGVLQAEDQQALAQMQLSNHQLQLEASRKALAAGSGMRTDVDEAQARVDLAQADVLQAGQQVEHARRQLQTLMDREPSALQGLDVQRLPRSGPQPAALADWIARAEAQSPELHSLRAQLEAARQEVGRAQGGHLPTLDLIGQLQRSKSENELSIDTRYHRRSVGLQLNVPLFSSGWVSSTVREALAEQQRVEHTLEATRRDLGLRVHQEHRGMTEGLARMQALEQAASSADQLVRSNRRSVLAGSRTLVDVFNAEQQRMVVLRDLAQARYQYLLSRIRLQALAGMDAAELMREINGYLLAQAPLDSTSLPLTARVPISP